MIKFEYQFDKTSPKVVVKLSAESTLDVVLMQFEGFLRAAGYSFDGELDFIKEEANV